MRHMNKKRDNSKAVNSNRKPLHIQTTLIEHVENHNRGPRLLDFVIRKKSKVLLPVSRLLLVES